MYAMTTGHVLVVLATVFWWLIRRDRGKPLPNTMRDADQTKRGRE